jgi:hypothetical protein
MLSTVTSSADLEQRRLEDCRRQLVFFENFADSLGVNLKDEYFIRLRKGSFYELHATHRKDIAKLRGTFMVPNSSQETIHALFTIDFFLKLRIISTLLGHNSGIDQITLNCALKLGLS